MYNIIIDIIKIKNNNLNLKYLNIIIMQKLLCI